MDQYNWVDWVPVGNPETKPVLFYVDKLSFWVGRYSLKQTINFTIYNAFTLLTLTFGARGISATRSVAKVSGYQRCIKYF